MEIEWEFKGISKTRVSKNRQGYNVAAQATTITIPSDLVQLISNDNVAITELVKNSYDAGSPIVDITFYGEVVEKESARGKGRKETTEKIKYIKKEGASITIYDQGSGMDFDTILHAWMEPATNYKKKKDNQNPSRKFSGEKGIGRFASAKISSLILALGGSCNPIKPINCKLQLFISSGISSLLLIF